MLINLLRVSYQINIMQKNSYNCENRFIGLKFFRYFFKSAVGGGYQILLCLQDIG